MICKWYSNNKKCKKVATRRAYVSANPKKGEPTIFPICDACAKLAPAHWTAKKIVAVIK